MPSLPASHLDALSLTGGGRATNNGEEACKPAVIMAASSGPEKKTLLICGAMGPDARFINGLYDLNDPGADPTFCARRTPGQRAARGFGKDGVWLYRAENGTWCVSSAECKSARSPVCWAYKDNDLWNSTGLWQVTVGDGWEAQQLELLPMSVRDAGALCKELAQRASAWATKNSALEAVALPHDALSWSAQECDLWFRTRGFLHPRERADLLQHASQGTAVGPKRGRVTVITPTTEARRGFHEKLWACFEAQDWPDKELVVVETYQRQSSAFFAARDGTDPRLTYMSFQLSGDQDWSIGLKRNICVHFATGEFIVHFDDDDLYAVNYVPSMIRAVGPHSLGAKLSTWYIFDKATNAFGFCDPEICGREQQLPGDLIRQRVYGYGFSYVYRREVFQSLQFEDVSFGEDYKFITGLQQLGGVACIAMVKDETGLCMHTQHGNNTSQASCVMLKEIPWQQVSDLDFADLPLVFESYLQAFSRAEERKPQPRTTTASRPPPRRFREVLLHSPVGSLRLRFTAGAVGSDVLAKVEDRLGGLPIGTKLWWLPGPDQASEAEREQILRKVISNLIPGLAQPGSMLASEHLELLSRIHNPVPLHSRIGARTAELWLSVPGDWSLEGDAASGQEVRLRVVRTSPAVRVRLDEMPNRESVSSIFHLEMPMDATVDDLRRVLGSRFPEWAEVTAQKPGRGRVALQDNEPVPDKVTLSDFAATVTAEMMLTKAQCKDFMGGLLLTVRSARIQRRLDQFLEEVAGDDAKYRGKLGLLLIDEIYPDVAAHVGLPRSVMCMRALKDTIQFHMQGDIEMFAIAAELETSLRNWAAAEGNRLHLQALVDEQSAAAAARAAAAAAGVPG